MKKQKIGIDIRAIGQQRTGDESYTLNLVKSLLKIDKKNQYFLFTDTKNLKEIKNKIFNGINEPENANIISLLPKSKFIWTFFALPRAVKKFKLNFLHVQYITPLWLPKKTKLLTTIHDVSFKVFPEFIKKSDLFFLNILIPLSLKRANKVIAISEFTKKEIMKYYKLDSSKIKTIYNGGVETKPFKEKFKSDIFKKLNLSDSYIFYVGTHQPRKDIPTLLKAFFELKKQNKRFADLKLVIGGKLKAHNYDPEINSFLLEARKNLIYKKYLKDLIFTGYLEDVDKKFLFEKAEVFVFPSLYEGFGVPLIEAMTFRTPVLCSDIACFKEIGGGAVQFYKAGNINSLIENLNKILENPEIKKNLIQKGTRRAQIFSWDKTAKDFLECLKTI